MTKFTEDELHAMPQTRHLMTAEELEQWAQSRKEAGRAIDVATCELGSWRADYADPYGVRQLTPEAYLETKWFVRSPESRGWVHAGDLPEDIVVALCHRIHLEARLFDAAAEKHPGWKFGAPFRPERIDDKAPDRAELIDWFRDSFPDEVRAIEAAFEEKEKWVASRKEAGRAIDIATCEVFRYPVMDADPYGVRPLVQIDVEPEFYLFVRSPESHGWVFEGDLPTDTRLALNDRVKLEHALFLAAVEKHPGWQFHYRDPERIDENAPDHDELIEWFRKSFPREARAIEATIVDERTRRLLGLPTREQDNDEVVSIVDDRVREYLGLDHPRSA